MHRLPPKDTFDLTQDTGLITGLVGDMQEMTEEIAHLSVVVENIIRRV